MIKYIFPLSLSLCLVVSPEVQVLLGNSFGLSGVTLYPTLIVVSFVTFFTLLSYGERAESEINWLRKEYGLWLPLTSIFASRVVFFVTASTIVLATSGYVFNEVFVSSFPNFGFAFLVLAFALVVNMVGGAFSRYVQVVLVVVWLTCITYLLAVGIGAETHPRSVGDVVFSIRGLLLPFLLMIGTELAFVKTGFKGFDFTPIRFFLGLFVVILVLGGWAYVMGKMVSPSLLSSAYIPHTKAASRLLGDPGRMVIGAAMISGTLALVNGLLSVLVCQFKQILAETLVPESWLKSKWFNSALVIVIGITPGLMMAKGMAGYDITEVYIRAALIFWLLHYCLLNGVQLYAHSNFRFAHGVVVAVLLGVGFGLVYIDENSLELLKAMGFILCGCGILAGLVQLICRKKCY